MAYGVILSALGAGVNYGVDYDVDSGALRWGGGPDSPRTLRLSRTDLARTPPATPVRTLTVCFLVFTTIRTL